VGIDGAHHQESVDRAASEAHGGMSSPIIFAAQRAAAVFLLTDLDVAMTFLDLADATRNLETSRRNHKNARTAYDTVLRFVPRMSLTGREESAIREKTFYFENSPREKTRAFETPSDLLTPNVKM